MPACAATKAILGNAIHALNIDASAFGATRFFNWNVHAMPSLNLRASWESQACATFVITGDALSA